MTRQEVKEFLKNSFGIEEPTEEQVTAYLNSIPRQQPTPQPNNAELERLKEVEKQFKALQGQSKNDANSIADLSRRINRMTAENVLAEKGLKPDDYKDFIDGLIGEDETATRARAEALANMFTSKLDAQKTSLETEFNEKLKNMTPNPSGGDGGNEPKTDDVKNAESLSFGGVPKEAKTAQDYYK